MMKCLILAGLFALASAHPLQGGGQPEPLCKKLFTYNNGSCYMVSAGFSHNPMTGQIIRRFEGLSWYRANRFCQRQHPNAHLVVINDAAEHEFLFNWIPNLDPLEMWIGLSYNITTMMYEWVNGDPVTYTSWEPFYGEPLMRVGGAAMMFASDVITMDVTRAFGTGLEVGPFWMTERAREELPFICEYNIPMIVDTGNGTSEGTNGTNGTNTTAPATTMAPPFGTLGPFGPPTFRPQIMQQEPQPMRLSDYIDFNGILTQRRVGDAKGVVAPSRYRQRGHHTHVRPQQYRNARPVMP